MKKTDDENTQTLRPQENLLLCWCGLVVPVVDEVVAIQIGTARKSQCRLGLVVPLEQQG